MGIEGLKNYQRRRHPRGWYFQDLPAPARQSARQWLERFVTRCQRRGRPLKPWLLALYVGQAKRLALHPPTSDWGRWMRARKGGLAVQRKYRLEGRDTTAIATRVRLARGAARVCPIDEAGPQTPKRPQVAPIIISGQSDGYTTSQEFAKQVAERSAHILSCDDRFYSIATGSRVREWIWELMIVGVP
jgi:hypothetical protein